MVKVSAAIRRMHWVLARICLAAVAAGLTCSLAEARSWRSYHRHGWAHHHMGHWRHHGVSLRYGNGRPRHSELNIAAIVVDANSGKTLYARNENEQRFPASITKVMTLYLLFEELEQGQMRLDSNIRISAFAAAQKPTKLGLRAGETIRVDDAIRAVVTRSANDIAVAIAEAIAGDEPHFAVRMTQKAHELGMTRTQFANASGLPDAGQFTTARDLAILGRAIEEKFPRYYRYFATRVFYFRHAAITNHNHLLDKIEGMDGIKTGYTGASGFNVLTSVKRNGHHIVAAVLGGSSARSRDHIMAGLIEDNIENGATVHTAAPVTTVGKTVKLESPRQSPLPETSEPGSASVPRSAFAANSAGPRSPVDPVRLASANTGSVTAARPRPAFVPGTPKPEGLDSQALRAPSNWRQARTDGSTASGLAGAQAGFPTATPSPSREVTGGAQPAAAKFTNRIGPSPQSPRPEPGGEASPGEARSGWIIQIGATADSNKAAELLARARSKGPKTLANARGFTEKVQKGSETLYRARFTGLEEEVAAHVCKTLRHAGFSCFTTKN
jgi:D-alanyl-D-alanine carboxypeptidase